MKKRTIIPILVNLVLLAPLAIGQGGGQKVYSLETALRDGAQETTIAFSGVAMLTGNLEAQSFFPPGKVADYWGFQYMRDNDPDGMGHNTSFLTRAACNVLHILTDEQLDALKGLALKQSASIDEYALQRFALMHAFRRLLDGDLPDGATDLDLDAVIAQSRLLYEIDGEMSFDRAVVFADIFRSFDASQVSYLDAMLGKGWASWPPITMDDVRERLAGMPQGMNVAVMTYAGDIYSWYSGSLEADVYFCPERHGTYYGGFYIKDAPAMGVEGYSIDEELTRTAGSALCDPAEGYVTPEQALLIENLVDLQRANLYAGEDSIVSVRTTISETLRSLIGPVAPTVQELDSARETVMRQSRLYGELDGENNFNYIRAFVALSNTLSVSQRAALMALRKEIMSGTYDDGTPFDFSVCPTPFLYSRVISDLSVLDPYLADSDGFFNVPSLACPWGFVSRDWTWSQMGWIHDIYYPYVYINALSCWAYILPQSTGDNLFGFLCPPQSRWFYTGNSWQGWVFLFENSGGDWQYWM